MTKMATKAVGNVWYEARFSASKFNEKLASREGAAIELGMDRTRLARIELNLLTPYPEEASLMADLYHTPELRNHFCCDMCPLGSNMPRIQLQDIDRITVKAMCTFRKMAETKEILLDITEDGIISADEKPELEIVIKNLDEVSGIVQNLKIWVEKNFKEVQ